MKKINIGILGYGTVGSAVDKLIRENHSLIADKTGLDLNVAAVCDTNPKVKHPKLVKNAYEAIKNPKISVIVETIGGEQPALNFILTSVKRGKHIVTSNKELIALHGDKILESAGQNNVSVRFEAAVGGGIPIIGPLSSDLSANDITEVYGIVNGTTNYILSKMTYDGMEFSEALQKAKDKGYAEADPKKDIEGYDASYKAAILASVAFRAKIDWKKVYFEGVSRIAFEDICYAHENGYAIKLLAIAKKDKEGCEVRVHPTLIPEDHALASVSGPMNAIYIKGNEVGELMFYGQGAGGKATASAVVADIIAAANPKSHPGLTGTNPKLKTIKIKPIDDIESRFYIRMVVKDRPGVLAKISKIFGDNKVSISDVIQKEAAGNLATLVIIVHEAKEKNFRRAIGKVKKLSVVDCVCNIIRII